MIDIHCHILPGIDDGSSSLEESVAMARFAASCGITTIVATPHHVPDIFPTTPKKILDALATLTREIESRRVPVQILSGQEIHIEQNTAEKVADQSLLTINYTNYVLLELPYSQIPPGTAQTFFRMRISGFTPIIAHP